MLTAIILQLLIGLTLANDTIDYKYLDENGKEHSIKVYDVANQRGEEVITWSTILNDRAENIVFKPDSVSADSYEASATVESNDGDLILDVNIGISLGAAFEQIKALLQTPEFKESFNYVSACTEKTVGFLILNNNIDSSMNGYCLSKK